ncbi:hypothetical protein DI396_01545 [Litorivita pollutaquae]|uniref:DUF1127 domain-containing protein n=1 Tax=Litorivita pollutaquae TaxID=2200892 RepID=A0A2V4MX02_9RHOB|nr:hypothetical protein [Litorivita pollutaquae]OUS20752.1 hypothetical protein A9Q95_10730 [Rhodobacterales bacterium 59_46_T64]PYC48808.1 hypothetical protein DI396_01545 [Litorivita pollutaquae]
MATHSTNISDSSLGLRAFFAAIGRGIERYVERKSRAGEIAALEAKSDAELSAMGLTRDGIALHVFRDIYYI